MSCTQKLLIRCIASTPFDLLPRQFVDFTRARPISIPASFSPFAHSTHYTELRFPKRQAHPWKHRGSPTTGSRPRSQPRPRRSRRQRPPALAARLAPRCSVPPAPSPGADREKIRPVGSPPRAFHPFPCVPGRTGAGAWRQWTPPHENGDCNENPGEHHFQTS